jgi:hypothetical protein
VLSYRKFMHDVSEYLALNHPFSQVIENIRRQSCEGLALPFLANWLLGKAQACFNCFVYSDYLEGDISNFLGCILTHQLPFQVCCIPYFITD